MQASILTLQEGQEVVCFGKLTLYEKNSTYNLNVYNVRPLRQRGSEPAL